MRGGPPGKLIAAARALFTPGPSPDALGALGLAPEDFEACGDVEVWPECWPAVMLMGRVRTQWRNGMAGATGLDYGVVFRLMDQLQLEGEAWDDMLEDIQTMEFEALAAMDEARAPAED